MHEIFQEKFQPIVGSPCWGVKKGYASSFWCNFGQPHLSIIEPKKNSQSRRRNIEVRGDWHLWIYCCNWRILFENIVLAHDEASDETINEALRKLDGQILTKVDIDQDKGTSTFSFELGDIVKTYPYADLDDSNEPYINWMLFDPSGGVLSFRADGKYDYGAGKEPFGDWH